MQKDEHIQSAEPTRVRVRDWFYHLVVYLFVLAILAVVSSISSGAFVWIALGWGFAVALHGVYAVFG